MANITDNKTYYSREKPIKAQFVKDFIKSKSNKIHSIYDVGCNNGLISYPLQKELKKEVLGVDLSKDLTPPKDYNFKNLDIVNNSFINFNDCTLFFSLYHHILGKYGLTVADTIFLKLLLKTKYLIFDVGNLSELNRKGEKWYLTQKQLFKSEDDLLNHFNIPYKVIGKWECGGGSRKVVIFKSKDIKFKVLKKYKRKDGTKYQSQGLFPHDSNTPNLFQKNTYFKLKWQNLILFSKLSPYNTSELENIKKIYNKLPRNKVIDFYGYSSTYGLIWEWLEDFIYLRKTKLKIGNVSLVDIDEIKVNNQIKYIDFER